MPDQPLAPLTEPVLNQPSIAATPAPKGHSKKWLWPTLIILVLGLLGGAYFAYSRGYLYIPGLSPKADALFSTMVEKMSTIQNAEYGFSVSIASESRAAGATPTFTNIAELENSNTNDSTQGTASSFNPLIDLIDPSSIAKALPSDVHLQVGMTLQAETDKVLKDADGDLHLTGTYQGGDSTYNVDIEAKKVGENMYFILNKIPAFPYFDLSSAKGFWTKITSDEVNDIYGDSWQTLDPTKGSNELKKYVSGALKNNIVTVKRQLPGITINGVKAARYQIELHPTQLVTTLQQLKADRISADANASVGDLDRMIADLQKPANQQQLQKLLDASEITIAVDTVKGFLRQVEWKMTIVPPNDLEKLAGKQFVFDAVFSLNKINEKVEVAAPNTTSTWDELIRKVTGISKATQDFQNQTSRISTIRQVLSSYYQLKKSFPPSITTLKADVEKAVADCEKTSNNSNVRGCSSYKYYYESLSQKSITDIYTGKPYEYSLDANDGFRLVYQIQFDSAVDSYTKGRYHEGKNTSTKNMLSVEANSKSYDIYESFDDYLGINNNVNDSLNQNGNVVNLNTNSNNIYACLSGALSKAADYDADTLSDYNEYYYFGTDPCKKDTDGDSYSDSTEVAGGFNPIGSGYATSAQQQAWAGAGPVGSAPKITNHSATQVNGVVTVTWKTDVIADGIINYGASTTYGAYVSSAPFVQNHAITFTVPAGKTYHYIIRSCAKNLPAATGCTSSPDYTITVP